MLFNLFNYISNGEYALLLVNLAALLFVVFCTTPVHEFAHAWTAVKLGDDTPRLQGRLTLRPMAHFDLFGTIMLLVAGVGYAKPVRVNMHNLKNGRKSFALVAIAGPVSNLIMAFVFTLCKVIVAVIYVNTSAPDMFYIVFGSFFSFAASINITLAVFNLLPIPPLDGSKIANLILPAKYYFTILKYERYIMIGLFVLLWTGILTKPLSWLSDIISTGFNYVAQLPFELLGLL